MMTHHWIILLLVGCAVAAPWPDVLEPLREISDQEKREIRLREVLQDSDNEAAEAVIEAVNTASDLTGNHVNQGDIMLTDEQLAAMKSGGSDKRSTTHFSVDYLWKKRVIPVVFHENLASATVTLIRSAFAVFHEKSCIRFVDRTNEPYYLYFQKQTGCWSFVGFINDARKYQEVSIGSGCEHLGVIIHEILHALGFWHEQSRPDRNSKVEIFWENIISGKENNFDKQNAATATGMKTNYDEGSIMHYANYAFSKNGKKTIQDIENPAKVFGQRDGLSDTDVVALNLLYSCTIVDGGWSNWTVYGPCSDSCQKVRYRFCTNSQNSAACDSTKQDGKDTQTAVCPNEECYKPVHGHWGKWGTWTTCDKTCGTGQMTRTRTCNDPAPKHGGNACSGSSTGTSSCQLKECGAGPGDCGFDDDSSPYCDWVQDPNDDKPTYKDIMRGASTPSGNTGPQTGDHSSGNGKFLYSEASDCISTTGKYVRLLSAVFPATGSSGRCFTFWYYGFGATLGDFNVYVKTATGEKKIAGFTAADLRAKSDEKIWKQAKFHFVESSQSYKIVLESKCGLDYRADFAFDDTKFINGACPT